MESLSIHPRNWPAEVRARLKLGDSKSNTAKPLKNGQARGKLAKQQKKLGRRRSDHSATLRSVPANHQNAYKTPGSMNPRRR